MQKNIYCILVLNIVCCINAYGQFNINTSETSSLESILDKLSNEYNLNFAYPSELISNKKVQPIIADYESLERLLSSVLSSSDLEFNIQNNSNILLRQKIKTQSETVYRFSCIIYNEEDNSPLSNASIYLDDFTKGTFSDDKGQFTMSLSESDLIKDIIISYIGFSELKISVNKISNQKTIFLRADPMIMEDVIIKHSKSLMKTDQEALSLKMGQEMLEANQGNLVGGSDLFRIIQTLPGVSSSDDSNANIKIRGSNPEETLIVLDGIPIYNADHYYGVFSAINSLFVNNIELHKNNLPIEFTGVNAGLLKMDSNHDSDKTNGTLAVNLLNTSFNISTPSNKKVVLNLAGRSTIANVNQFKLFESDQSLLSLENLTDNYSKQLIRTDPDFSFFDLNSKLTFNLSEKSNLSFSSFVSQDNYLNVYSNEFETKKGRNRIINQETLCFTENWGNTGGAIAFNHSISEDITLKLNVFGSKYSSNSKFESAIIQKDQLESNIELKNYSSLNSIQDIGSSLYLKDNKNFKIGVSWNQYQTAFDLIDLSDTDNKISTKSNQFSAFGSYTFHLNKLTLNLGNRFSMYGNTLSQSTFAISPQLLGTYAFNEYHTLKFSLSRNNQFIRKVQFENRLGQLIETYQMADDESCPIGTSVNYMLGYSLKKSDWSFDVELFYKDIGGIIEYTDTDLENNQQGPSSQNTQTDLKAFQGTSYCTGADFMLSYNKKNYTSWIAYSIIKTENQIEEILNNTPYPNENDRRHQFKWINQVHLNNWNFSANVFYTSGKAYLSYNQVKSDRGDNTPHTSIDHLPYYGRVDLGAKYSFPMFGKKASISCSIFNITDRQNVKFIQQTYALPSEGRDEEPINVAIGNESNLLSRSIDLGFQFNF